MARGLKFWIKKVEGLYYEAKPKVLISFPGTVKLICIFVFPYAKCLFSHDAAYIVFRVNFSVRQMVSMALIFQYVTQCTIWRVHMVYVNY